MLHLHYFIDRETDFEIRLFSKYFWLNYFKPFFFFFKCLLLCEEMLLSVNVTYMGVLRQSSEGEGINSVVF